MGAGQPPYDLAWEHRGTTYVAVVKSITQANEEKQLRLGLGQVLRYEQLVEGSGKPVQAVLVPESEPSDPTWKSLCRDVDIVLVWPGVLALLRSVFPEDPMAE